MNSSELNSIWLEEPLIGLARRGFSRNAVRSEEHTSELQSQSNLVCRLLLEKKKKIINTLYLETRMVPHETTNILSVFDITLSHLLIHSSIAIMRLRMCYIRTARTRSYDRPH